MEERNSFLKDIVEAKKEFKPIKMDKVNPHFSSKYASLNSIMDSIEKPLLDRGIQIVHRFCFDEQGQWLSTLLRRDDGQQTDPSDYLLFDRNGAMPTDHKKGSGSTYGKRNNISALLSLTTEEDDDGNASSARDKKPAKSKPLDVWGILVEHATKQGVKGLTVKKAKEILKTVDIVTDDQLKNYTSKAAIDLIKEKING